MAVKTRLKKGDRVRVIAGKHKGLEGKVMAVRSATCSFSTRSPASRPASA